MRPQRGGREAQQPDGPAGAPVRPHRRFLPFLSFQLSSPFVEKFKLDKLGFSFASSQLELGNFYTEWEPLHLARNTRLRLLRLL